MEKKLIMNTQYIDYHLQENNLTKKEFAKKCGISLHNLNDIYEQNYVDIFVVLKVVQTLKIKSDTFLFRDKSYPKKIYVV